MTPSIAPSACRRYCAHKVSGERDAGGCRPHRSQLTDRNRDGESQIIAASQVSPSVNSGGAGICLTVRYQPRSPASTLEYRRRRESPRDRPDPTPTLPAPPCLPARIEGLAAPEHRPPKMTESSRRGRENRHHPADLIHRTRVEPTMTPALGRARATGERARL